MAKHVASLTLIGPDKTGVIARITQLLFQLGANIEALEEQVTVEFHPYDLSRGWIVAVT